MDTPAWGAQSQTVSKTRSGCGRKAKRIIRANLLSKPGTVYDIISRCDFPSLNFSHDFNNQYFFRDSKHAVAHVITSVVIISLLAQNCTRCTSGQLLNCRRGLGVMVSSARFS